MSNLQQFSFNSQSVRVISINGETWFVAQDVCDVLEVGNVSQALNRLDDDEKNTIILNDGKRGNPNTAIISESGLYSLTLAFPDFYAGGTFHVSKAKLQREGKAYHSRHGEYFYLNAPEDAIALPEAQRALEEVYR